MSKLKTSFLSILLILIGTLFIFGCADPVNPSGNGSGSSGIEQIKPGEGDIPVPKPDENDYLDLSKPKDLIIAGTTQIVNGERKPIPNDPGVFEYAKEGTRFNNDDYIILLAPDSDVGTDIKHSINLSLVKDNGMKETNVQWFVDAMHCSPTSTTPLYLFTPEETKKNHTYAYQNSSVIINQNGDGSVTIKGTDRFSDTEYMAEGYIIAVVDGKYIHRKPFHVLNNKEIEKYKNFVDRETLVKAISEPMMGYSDLEKAFLMNKTAVDNLTYDYGFLGQPSDYNTFVIGKAVCQGYAWMLNRLGEELGMNVANITGGTPTLEDGHHAWNAIWVEDGYYYVDSTWNDNEYIDPNGNTIYKGNILSYFFKKPDDFEKDHEAKDLHMGAKYLIEKQENKEMFQKMVDGFTGKEDTFTFDNLKTAGPRTIKVVKSKSADIPVPDLEKITFTGIDDKSGFLTTTESDIEYNTGDGIWHSLTANSAAKVTNINMQNKSSFYPRDIASLIGNPQFILLRRKSGDTCSNYVKLSILKPTGTPGWVQADKEKGCFKYVSNSMEYSRDYGAFTPITNNELKLESGTYRFRMKGGKNSLASELYEISVN